MNNTIEYKGYVGSVEFSEEDALFFGKVMGVGALISYDGENARALISNFHDAVDEYLEVCAAERIEPEKAYRGNFSISIPPELHKRAAITAAEQQITLNSFIKNSIERAVSIQN